jgi:hypothetical protein
MNLRRTIALILNVLHLVCIVNAQAVFSPATDVVNMGEVMFKEPVKAVFAYRNTGNQPLEIIEVYPSCGCTAVEWTRGEIPVGGEGTITAEYDAQMLGTFQKDILVYTNIDDEPISLYLQGRVVTELTDQTTSDDNFPIAMGGVCLKTKVLDFGDIAIGENKTIEIQVLNTGMTTYRPQLMHLPSYLTAEYHPEMLNAGRVGRIRLIMDANKMHQYGEQHTSIYLSRHLGDKVNEENKMEVSYVLLPDFSSMTLAERIRAPRLQVEGDTVITWMPKRWKRKRLHITLKNKGLSDLEILALQLPYKGVEVSLTERHIQPNATAKLKVSITADDLSVEDNEIRLLLISNDPQKPKQSITIKVKE